MVRRTLRVFAVAALLSLLALPGWGQPDAGYDAYKRGDYATAHRVWKSLADRGDASAQYNLGLLYHRGLGIERQLGEAAKWYARAAENGDADGQKAIGDLYVQGFWGKKDTAKAATWYRMAAEQGHAEAKKSLRELEAKRQVRPRQPARSNAPIPSLSPAPADTSVQPAVGVYPKTYEEIGFALTQTILNPTPAARDSFGQSVAISGGKVLVGAWGDDAGAKNSGAAYLFDAATGKLLHTVLNPTPARGDAFGRSVAISGDKVLIGAAGDDDGAKNSGAAYLFDAATGKLLHTFLNPTPAAGDGFGWSVAISGGKVLIGAGYDDAGAKNSGAAYLFDAATGKLLRTFLNPTPGIGDSFGYSVAISGGMVFVGAVYDDAGARNSGAAYLFDAATGKLLHTFLNPTPAVQDQFGASVAISGDKVLIGARFDNAGAKNSGAAYLFDAATGKLLRTFLNPTPAARDYFGQSVAISGDKVLVGAWGDDAGAKFSGAAYLFDAGSGKLLHTFLNPAPSANDQFGVSVAISGDKVLIGAKYDDAGAYDSGAAYLFSPGPTSPRQTAQSKSDYQMAAEQGHAEAKKSLRELETYEEIGFALTQTILNPTPAVGDSFGWSVAISGGKVLIGAWDDDAGATDSGAAHLFDAATGKLLRTFLDPTPATYKRSRFPGEVYPFGFAITISGDKVLIGVPLDDTGAKNSGAAYLFDAATGKLLRTFLNPTPAADDRFGASAAISGDKVLIGAWRDDAGAEDSGAAYLFDAATGKLLHTFLNPTPARGDWFGSSVAISGDKMLIGAVWADDAGAKFSGAAYLFDAATGKLLHTFLNPTPGIIDSFGSTVAISGGKVLIGARFDDTGAKDSGAAYLFDAATGKLLHTFLNPTPANYDQFGASVAISGDKVLIGAPNEDAGAKFSGAAYLFDAATGKLLHTFLKPTPAIGDGFGRRVAISGDTVLIGASGDDAGAYDSGAAYLFSPVPTSPRQPARSNAPIPSLSPAPADTSVQPAVIVYPKTYEEIGFALTHTFLNPTPAFDDRFGGSVAISGDKVLIGAEGDDAGAKDSGAAYLFDAATGKLLRTFFNPTPATYEPSGVPGQDYSFGSAIAISGDKVLVGAGYDAAGAKNSGAAYLFDAATGKLLRTFLNPTPAFDDRFGTSVAISGDKVLIGAQGDDAGAKSRGKLYSGAAYLFDAATGKLRHTYLNPTPARGDFFGRTVAVSGDKVLIGAGSDDAGAKNSGAAYLFDAATGKLLHTFLNPTPAAGDGFGYPVAISGDKVFLGAVYDDAGAAYLFDAGSGNLLHTILNPTPTSDYFGDYFGSAIAISGDKVLIGAPGEDAHSGAAYLTDAATGKLLHTFLNPTPAALPAALDVFGWSVAISGDKVLIGAQGDDAGAKDSGAAYLFSPVPTSPRQTVPSKSDYSRERQQNFQQMEKLSAQGRYKDALPFAEKALKLAEREFGPNDQGTAFVLIYVAGIYKALHRYATAESLYKRSLAIREKVLGPEHLGVAHSLNNLAELYRDQGEYTKAEPLLKRALAIAEKAPRNRQVGVSLGTLALIYEKQRKFARAESFYQRALREQVGNLGPMHRHVATTLDNLAWFYYRQDRYVEAEPLWKRAQAIWEKTPGPKHTPYARSLGNLAMLYKAQGKYARAEPLAKRELAIYEKVLGPEHPDVALGLDRLAGLYTVMGRYSQAESLAKRALAIWDKNLDPRFPNEALDTLAELYHVQGRHAEAESFYKRSLAIREALRPGHPIVAQVLEKYAVLLRDTGRDVEAAKMEARAKAIQAKHAKENPAK